MNNTDMEQLMQFILEGARPETKAQPEAAVENTGLPMEESDPGDTLEETAAPDGSAADANSSLSIDAIQQPSVEATLSPFDGGIPNPTAVGTPSPSDDGSSKGAELPDGDSQKEP